GPLGATPAPTPAAGRARPQDQQQRRCCPGTCRLVRSGIVSRRRESRRSCSPRDREAQALAANRKTTTLPSSDSVVESCCSQRTGKQLPCAGSDSIVEEWCLRRQRSSAAGGGESSVGGIGQADVVTVALQGDRGLLYLVTVEGSPAVQCDVDRRREL